MRVKVVGGVFRIPQVRQEDRGVYICEAENSAGTDFATVTIEIESTFITCDPLEQYCNHLRVCVCLSVCLSVCKMTDEHGYGCPPTPCPCPCLPS